MQTRAPSSDMSVSSLSSHSFQAATPTSLLYIGVPDIEQASCVLCWGVLLHASAAAKPQVCFKAQLRLPLLQKPSHFPPRPHQHLPSSSPPSRLNALHPVLSPARRY